MRNEYDIFSQHGQPNRSGKGTTLAELRPYQQELLEQAEAALQPADARVMLQLPTGGGKTHIAGVLLRHWLHSGRKAVWLTHRTELAEQTRRMLTDAGVSAINLTWRPGSDAPFIANGVVILMAQTVGRRTNRMQIWGKYRSDDLLVIDEAHHATADGYERAIDQWPGQVIGLTATPWRLSKIEGFDHLFKKLLFGPQVSELQAGCWLCQARVLMPKPEEIIRGGAFDAVGEYSESGIAQANQDRPDVMTAGALRFWQFHAAERQTVVYAISQDHARKLTAVFNDAGIPAAVMLSDTLPDERARAIADFGNGTLRVLVNVAVATEGFDLPDASCVVITRPTMSLALYLQMVGRGLRPKANGGNCLILDLAGNAEIHGLPEETRQWSLEARGNKHGSKAPVIRCEKCDGVSHAASQNCAHCGAPFGKDCPRCGVWRAWQRWNYETRCGQQHELVCDLCHYDAHIQAQLPVTDELRRLTDMEPNLDAALRNLLEEERRRASGADEERKEELRSLISSRESELAGDDVLDKAFKQHLSTLRPEEQPQRNWPQMVQLYNDWQYSLNQELASWKDELSKLESKIPDGRVIYKNARERLLKSLESVAQEAGLLPPTVPGPNAPPVPDNSSPVPSASDKWTTFVQLRKFGLDDPNKGSQVKPVSFRDPQGNEKPIKNWADLYVVITEWLIKERLLSESNCPVRIGSMTSRCLVHSEPRHPNGREFKNRKRLSNDLYLELQMASKAIARICQPLVAEFGQDPAQFHVLLK